MSLGDLLPRSPLRVVGAFDDPVDPAGIVLKPVDLDPRWDAPCCGRCPPSWPASCSPELQPV